MLLNPGSSRLRASTIAIDDPGPLHLWLPTHQGSAFLRGGEGLIAMGEVARFETDSLLAADVWWSEFSQTIENETEMPGRFGTGPIALGSFCFDPDGSPTPSVLIVPEIIIGSRDGRHWLTKLGYDRVDVTMPPRPPVATPPGEVSFEPGEVKIDQWLAGIQRSIGLIDEGVISKIVLARDVIATAAEPIDGRWVLDRLLQSYPECWSFMVDGLIGASPEMLIHRRGNLTTSRILAGSIPRRGLEDESGPLTTQLISSAKDHEEHRIAVESAVNALASYFTGMHVPKAPYVLELPNVLHLATDICGVADPEYSVLALAAAVHPTAAVCGTPTHVAMDLISQIEKTDRGRFAGPVGWIDTQGDGEWALALRCGQLNQDDNHQLRMFAGCGVMADSDPVAELAETEAKLAPMRHALSEAG